MLSPGFVKILRHLKAKQQNQTVKKQNQTVKKQKKKSPRFRERHFHTTNTGSDSEG